MSVPDDKTDMHVVPRADHLSKLLDTAATESTALDPETIPPPPRSGILRRALIYVGTALLAAFAAASADYWFEREHSVPVRPLSVLKPIRQALPTPPSPPLQVSPDLLHVTSIALGHIPLTVVNGKRLAEGDWLELRTSDGVAALHVLKIEDGAVQFGYGGKVISGRFDGRASDK